MFDVVVVGGGPGGCSCSLRASQLGKRVCIVESGACGGTCLNRGCIPTKALLHAGHSISSAQRWGPAEASASSVSVDPSRLVGFAQRSVEQLRSGLDKLLAQSGVTLVSGSASFASKNSITVNGREIGFKSAVIATGAVPRKLSLPENIVRSGLIWGASDALSFSSVPKRLLVIGSGAIGVEFASFFRDLGSAVTIIEAQDRLLPLEDEEISKEIFKNFSHQRGIRVFLKAEANNFLLTSLNSVEVSFSNVCEVFDRVLIAIGVIPNSGGLELHRAGVLVGESSGIIVDRHQRTNIDGIFAIGDVCGGPMLAHKASQEGLICAERICGISDEVMPLDLLKIPSCVYCSPQIASIGMKEKQAKDQCENAVIGKCWLKSNGKAVSSEGAHGFVKVIFDKQSGEILGAHMLGENVSEIISVISLAMSAELTYREIINTIFPHPTVSECIKEAAFSANLY